MTTQQPGVPGLPQGMRMLPKEQSTGELGTASAVGHGQTYSGDNALHNQLLRTVFLQQLLRNEPPKLPRYTAALLPVADETQRDAVVILEAPAADDQLIVCVRLADGSYIWRDTEPQIAVPPLGFSAADFGAIAGSPDLSGRGSDNAFYKYLGWSLDSASAEYIGTSFRMPSNWDGDIFDFNGYIAFSTGGAGSVQLAAVFGPADHGEQIDQTGNVTTFGSVVTSPGVADQMVKYSRFGAFFAAAGDPANKRIRLVIYRDPADVDDTYAADIWFLGFEIIYGVV